MFRRLLMRYPFRGRWLRKCVLCDRTYADEHLGPIHCPDCGGRLYLTWLPRS